MRIALENVIPSFLEPEKIQRSEVWNKNIEIHKGEKLQVVAPSGSGKTSLVHFLYGLRNDFTGSIYYNKKNISGFTHEHYAELRSNTISVIFQDLRLFTEQTVFENIEIKKALKPFNAAGSIKEMAARLGIENKLNNKIKTCSYGEQQRVAIIRALQQPYDFLIMDEPFSHLDENNREIACGLIEEETKKRNAGLILGDLKIIDFFGADRVLHL